MKHGRAPQGARGLKYDFVAGQRDGAESRPARGAWVEIKSATTALSPVIVAPRKGRVG